ncbi:hypothetical protein GDO86_013831 [Hymenochirus boettgeri]|uniref:Uncharacterized protein n=1 Tax=Hymenochirus boettgeri TaxID=247094 RepID=A0A8T2JLP3_9PIPI|nr:hypothetical protein GDO86_013831 [Hymenochirus boettgeri]
MPPDTPQLPDCPLPPVYTPASLTALMPLLYHHTPAPTALIFAPCNTPPPPAPNCPNCPFPINCPPVYSPPTPPTNPPNNPPHPNTPTPNPPPYPAQPHPPPPPPPPTPPPHLLLALNSNYFLRLYTTPPPHHPPHPPLLHSLILLLPPFIQPIIPPYFHKYSPLYQTYNLTLPLTLSFPKFPPFIQNKPILPETAPYINSPFIQPTAKKPPTDPCPATHTHPIPLTLCPIGPCITTQLPLPPRPCWLPLCPPWYTKPASPCFDPNMPCPSLVIQNTQHTQPPPNPYPTKNQPHPPTPILPLYYVLYIFFFFPNSAPPHHTSSPSTPPSILSPCPPSPHSLPPIFKKQNTPHHATPHNPLLLNYPCICPQQP